MQFTEENARLVMDGKKTMTRRVVDYGDQLGRRCGFPAVFDQHGRMKWVVTGRYAVQNGRGKKSLGKIEITAIRQARLQDIVGLDCRSEGLAPDMSLNEFVREVDLRERFEKLWDGLGLLSGHRWKYNPLVWVISFRVVDDA